MTLTATQIDKLSEMQFKAAHYRGQIIGFSTSLEGKINQFLSEYFVPDNDKRNHFVTIFFSSNGLTLRHKQKALTHIIKTDNKFKSFLTNHPNFIKDLDNAISNRNDMAHSKLHSTIENIDNFDGSKFVLQSYNTSRQGIFKEKLIQVDLNDIKAETDKIMTLSITMDDLIKGANP